MSIKCFLLAIIQKENYDYLPVVRNHKSLYSNSSTLTKKCKSYIITIVNSKKGGIYK